MWLVTEVALWWFWFIFTALVAGQAHAYYVDLFLAVSLTADIVTASLLYSQK